MNEIRHPLPTATTTALHLRDLLLLAAHDAAEHGWVEYGPLVDADVIDVVALGAHLVGCQLRALTAATRSLQARHLAAADVFATAQAIAIDPRAVGAIGTVVGAAGDGELATAAAIADALAAFDPIELVNATIAMCAAALRALAESAGATVTEIVSWSAGDPVDAAAEAPVAAVGTVPARPARAPYCARDAFRSSVASRTR